MILRLEIRLQQKQYIFKRNNKRGGKDVKHNWADLYNAAKAVLNPRTISKFMEAAQRGMLFFT